MTSRPDVLIVGGGIIGAAFAAELSQRGIAVTLIDKGPIGHGCSYGNAGWITPSFALPLPRPGMLLKSLKWLCDRDSPLYIQPRLDWELARWLLRFVRSMNHASLHRAAAALTELSTFGLDFYRDLAAQRQSVFGFQQRGLLVVAQTEAGRQAAGWERELVGKYGIAGRELDADGVRALEPAITGPGVCGGVYYPAERTSSLWPPSWPWCNVPRLAEPTCEPTPRCSRFSGKAAASKACERPGVGSRRIRWSGPRGPGRPDSPLPSACASRSSPARATR